MASDTPAEALRQFHDVLHAEYERGRAAGHVVDSSDHYERISPELAAIDAAIAEAVAEEREACAQLAEQHGAVYPVRVVVQTGYDRIDYLPFADLIRARTTP